MTPKQKAKQLVKKYEDFTTIWIDEDNFYKSPKLAKRGALIAVDEILKNNKILFEDVLNDQYWEEIKSEIEKL